MRIRRPGPGPGGVATHTRIIGKLLAAAPGRNAGRRISYEPEAERVCRDADKRTIPRRHELRRPRPSPAQLSSTQHRVAGLPFGGRSRAPGSSARMAKRMLIDAAHPEETRVVVTSGTRLEEFDFESSTKKQVKGNIYLAKVTRVEPSLQAAFVDYGNNRHGFLAFSEIHPDYFKIPVADREPNDIGPVHEEAETREPGSEIHEGAGISLAAALPELVPVPAIPESSEDETAEPELPEQPGFAAGETPSPIAA